MASINSLKLEVEITDERIQFIHTETGDAFYITFDLIKSHTGEQIKYLWDERLKEIAKRPHI